VFTATVQAYDTNNVAITDGTFDGAPVTTTGSGLAQFDSNGDATYGDNIKALVNGAITINVRDLKTENITITAGLGANTATSASVSITAGAFARLQLLLPGETAAPGTVTGRTGTPNVQSAGTGFNITVKSVDANWNSVNTNDTVHLTQSGDANVILPADTALVGGTVTLSVTNILTGVGQSLSVSDVSNGGIAADTSSAYTVVSGAAVRLVLLAPGESPTLGVAPGKTGTPSDQLQTGGFTVTVYALDAYYNLAQNNTDVVHFTSTDGTATLPANAALVSGTKSFVLINNMQGSITETASDISNGSVASGSTTLTVDPVQNFRTVQSGNWGDTSTWEYSSDSGMTWTPAVTTPSSALTAVVEITNGITVTVASSVTVNRTTVDAGATLSVPTSVTLTVASGSGADLNVFGALNNAGVITNISPATTKIESGAVYYHNQNGGAVPTASWDTNSTCEVIGWTAAASTTAVTGLGQSFGHLTWNSTNQTSSLSIGGSPLTTIKGNFTVKSTGTGVLKIAINGNITATIKGDMNVQGGIVNLCAGSGPVIINLEGNLSVTGGTLTSTGSVATAFNFTKAGTQTLTQSGSSLIPSTSTIAWKIASNSILNLGTNVLRGAGSFTVSPGGGVMTAKANGFAGNFTIPTTNISLSQGNCIYNGVTTQSGDTLLPATVAGLTVNNNQGLVLNQAETVTNLNLNGSTLTGNVSMGSPGAFTVTGTNSKVVGNVTMNSSSLVLVSSNNLPELTVQGGTLNSSAAGIVLTVLGSSLPQGHYLLVDANTGGSVTGGIPDLVTVNGSGLLPGLIGSPQIIGGKLYLNVVAFFTAFDAGGDPRGGEDLMFTNAAGIKFFAWSTTNPSLPVSSWTLEGQMNELPLSATNSRYGIQVNPIASPTFYVFGTTNGGPYLVSPVPALVLTTDDYAIFNVIQVNVGISSVGVLSLAPAISASQAMVGGAFELQFSGPIGLGYSISASTDLTSWTIIGTGTFSSLPVTFTDTNATNYPAQFYRISIP
jgi:hypothetical protein